MATEGKERVLSTSVRWAAGTERHRLAACKQQALFPQLWSRRSPRPRCWHCQVGAFSVLTGGGGRGPLQLLSGHRSHSRWLRPRDLITRPKLPLPTLSPFGARISHMNCGGCKHSDRSRGASLTWDPRNRRTGKCISGQWGGRAHPEGQARVFAAALRQAACCVSCPGQAELLTGWEPGGGGWGLRVGAGLLSCSRFESLTLSCHKRSLDL